MVEDQRPRAREEREREQNGEDEAAGALNGEASRPGVVSHAPMI